MSHAVWCLLASELWSAVTFAGIVLQSMLTGSWNGTCCVAMSAAALVPHLQASYIHQLAASF
jgi:hypothetical protein